MYLKANKQLILVFFVGLVLTISSMTANANKVACDWILRIPPPIKVNSELSTDSCYEKAKEFLKGSKIKSRQTTGNIDLYLDWTKNLSDHRSCRMFFKNLKAASSRYPSQKDIDSILGDGMFELLGSDPEQSIDLAYLTYDGCKSMKSASASDSAPAPKDTKSGIN